MKPPLSVPVLRIIARLVLLASVGIVGCRTGTAANAYEPDAFTVFLWHLDAPAADEPYQYADAGRNGLHACPASGRVAPMLASVTGLSNAVYGFHGDSLLRTGCCEKLMAVDKGFTIELWLRDPLTGDGWQNPADENAFSVIAQYRAQKVQWWLRLRHRDKALLFSAIAEGNNLIYASVESGALTWQPYAWYHLAATFGPVDDESVTVTLYRTQEGDPAVVPLAQATVSSPAGDRKLYPVMADGEIRIGGAGSGSRFLGCGCAIDEVRYSAVARTADDFAEHCLDQTAEKAKQ